MSQLGSLFTLVETLKRSDVSFDLLFAEHHPRWLPDWVPSGYSHIAWEVFPPAEITWTRRDIDARKTAFVSAIERIARSNDSLLLVFEGLEAFVLLSGNAVVRHAGLILNHERVSGSPLWVTSPPAQWLVEVSSEFVTVGEQLLPSTGMSESERLCLTLDGLSVPYQILDTPPGHPLLPDIPLIPIIPPLRATILDNDSACLYKIAQGFVEGRMGAATIVQLIPASRSRIHMSLEDFLATCGKILCSAENLNISAPAANWLLAIRRRLDRTWIEGMF